MTVSTVMVTITEVDGGSHVLRLTPADWRLIQSALDDAIDIREADAREAEGDPEREGEFHIANDVAADYRVLRRKLKAHT